MMNDGHRKSILCLIAGISFSALGCGDSKKLSEVYPATGRVLLDGKPAEGVAITLIPDEGASGRGGYALSDASGSFSVKSVEGQDGVAQGKYRVTFQKLTMPDGSPLPPGTSAADVEAKNALPEVYSNPDASTMFAIVSAGANSAMEFALSSKRRN